MVLIELDIVCDCLTGYVDCDPLDNSHLDSNSPSPTLLSMQEDEDEIFDSDIMCKLAGLQSFLRCRHLYTVPLVIFVNAKSTAQYLLEFLADCRVKISMWLLINLCHCRFHPLNSKL
jgi:hypothetical protein